MATGKCKQCGTGFEAPKKKGKQFCSDKCSLAWHAEKFKDRNPGRDLPRDVVGTMSELIVCTDLLGKGYEVFRSITPTALFVAVNGSADVKIIRVRTAYRSASGGILAMKDDPNGHTVAYVVGTEITYVPPLAPLQP